MAVEVTLAGGALEDTQQADRPPDRAAEHLQRGAALGRYLVIDVLGRGGMSVVYAAFDPQLDRKVAIKLVRPELEGGSEATARLLREAQAMAKVLHPNVVTVHDVGTWEGRVFLAMELIDGTTLRDWLTQKPRTRREVLALFNAAGLGLTAAHAAGLVHRDFKPDNVLVGSDGRARVTDFGLVRPAHAGPDASLSGPLLPVSTRFDSNSVLTEAGAVLGTPAYMAPEQLLGRVADARADQFAFAVALYEALYGERPFEAKDFATTYEAVTQGRVRPPPSGRHVPGHLRRVLLRALSVEPEQRFPSMQALLIALRQDPVARLRRFSLGAAVVVLALSGPGLIGWRAQRETLRCARTVQELDGVWDDARRARLAQVFTAPDLPPRAWDLVRDWADRYAAQWKEARVAACEASPTGTDDARLVAASGRCIESRRLQFKAVLDLLLTSDAASLALAERAFGGVGSVKACVGGLAAHPGAPAAADADVIELIARARAHVLIGSLEAGEADARQALETARSRGLEALAAAALLELGRAAFQQARAPEALAWYRQSLLAAEATGEAELSFDVRLEIGQVLAEYLERYDEALWVLQEAQATAQRLSLPPERIALLLFRQASALEQADRPRDALPLAERSLALSRANAVSSGDLLEGLQSLANLHSDLGHAVLSSRYYEEYLAAQQTSSLRPRDYAIPLAYSGEELVLVGEYERGLARLQQARAVLAPVGGGAAQAILVDSWISYTAAALGQSELSQRARASAEAGRGKLTLTHHVAEVLQMLAWADLYEGRLSASMKGSRAAMEVLSPTAGVNRAAVLENVVGLVEAQRRLGRFAEAHQTLTAALAQAAEQRTDLEAGLAHARALLLNLALDLHTAPADAAELVAADLAREQLDLGPDNPDLATTHLALGRAELARGHFAAGVAALERTIGITERRPGDAFAIAEARFTLAQALAPTEAARARTLAQAAHDALVKLPEPVPLTKTVERWLATPFSPSGVEGPSRRQLR